MTPEPLTPLAFTPRTLVVDLDGTLIKTDLLLESANWFVSRHPLGIFRLLPRLVQSRESLKAELAGVFPIDAGALPYHEGLLTWLREQKQSGRYIVLATASHRVLAEAVAMHIGLFDEVLTTDENVNLRGAAKHDVLTARFGASGFDYVGNDHADLAVWNAAAEVHVVAPDAALLRRCQALEKPLRIFASERKSFVSSFWIALRPYQWVKNLLVFIPFVAAHHFYNLGEFLASILSFLSFCMTASGLYLLNDLIDVGDDRHHHRKRGRPFAAGDMGLLSGWLLWPSLVLAGCLLALLTLPLHFLIALASYAALTLAYSFYLKRFAMLDVVTLAALYTSRVIAGGLGTSVQLSFWLLSFSMFMFLSLAFVKRFCELGAKTGAMRLRGRGYYIGDLEIVSSMGICSGYIAVLILAMYIQEPRTLTLYRSPQFIWFACPLLLYWISRIWLIANRGKMHDDPIVFALKDKPTWLVGALFAVIFTLAQVVE